MARRLKVEMMLDDAQLMEFRAVVTDRRATVSSSLRWMIDHGYGISRNAVWNYWKHARKQSRPVTNSGDADFRASIATSTAQLTGRDLFILAKLAADMAGSAAPESGDVRTSA